MYHSYSLGWILRKVVQMLFFNVAGEKFHAHKFVVAAHFFSRSESDEEKNNQADRRNNGIKKIFIDEMDPTMFKVCSYFLCQICLPFHCRTNLAIWHSSVQIISFVGHASLSHPFFRRNPNASHTCARTTNSNI
jgi:hypothetical protein